MVPLFESFSPCAITLHSSLPNMCSIPSILRRYHCLCDIGVYAFGFSCRLVLC